MKLEKAIEILGLSPEYTEDGEPIGEAGARRLGIEALKVLVMFRDSPWTSRFYKLPGESED